MAADKKKEILEFIKENPSLSSKEIHNGLELTIGYATVKRILTKLISDKLILPKGEGRGRKYIISPSYKLFYTIDVTQYFEKEIDDRDIIDHFNLSLITDVLNSASIFTEDEIQFLNDIQEQFKNNVSKLSKLEYLKELERLAIDLSWKSSQIEGNTYSLLETERLLKEKETAKGKPKDEAIMLLNHKEAIDFIVEHPDYVKPLTILRIEDIHSILVKDLGVEQNIRKRRVGISGTNYKPLDNEYQIKEALNDMCKLINNRDCVFEKALLALVLLSYIQAFGDGNKRTARIISNAILISNTHCPLSFRTIDAVEYKKAMLIFYEQNNISAFKKIFIDQFEFAVRTYF
ncbi:MAG: Fic family protein [Candidatus Marinimicrobia bacterium]|nr:Fic family protein [Candidatus Neomarinimicrobiota bacterium]